MEQNGIMNKKIKVLLNIILVIILCYSSVRLVIWFNKTNHDEKNIEQLKEEMFIDSASEINQEVNEIDKIGELNKVYETDVVGEMDGARNLNSEEQKLNFDKLHKVNKDIKGWIDIETLDISYPILQSTDNNYYLKRDYNKKSSVSGSIFLDYRNDEFDDENTVLYGHNMKNGTMFGNLKKIINKEIYGDLTVNIETKEEILEYKIFSSYVIKSEEFRIDQDVESMLKNSEIFFYKKIKENPQILTLVTCTEPSTERVIVHAFLNKKVKK